MYIHSYRCTNISFFSSLILSRPCSGISCKAKGKCLPTSLLKRSVNLISYTNLSGGYDFPYHAIQSPSLPYAFADWRI